MSDKKRLLVLEDEHLIRFGFCEALREAGFEVAPAATAAETRALLEAAASFDLVVLNIQLPDGDGCDLCEEIRNKGVACPILMQSGYDVGYKIGRALEAGASAYLSKPFSSATLVRYVQLLLDLPYLVAEETRHLGPRGRNRPDVEGYAAILAGRAVAGLHALVPLPGTYPEHPVVDEKPAPTIPYTEKQADELGKLLIAIRDHLAGQSDKADERNKLIAQLTHHSGQLASWLGGRATVATDEALKVLVKLGTTAYVAHATGFQDLLVKLILALIASGGGH